jgi:transcriptional regulator with XRE-family HTH domain
MIGANVKELLEARNMTQYRLAKMSGISRSYICELVKGKYQNPSIQILKAISKALGVSITRLMKEAS